MEQLEKRGSWVAKAKKKALRPKPKARPKPKLPKIGNLAEIIKTLPNYDPYRGADDYYFDEDTALAAIEFFHKKIVHIKGAKTGEPFILEVWEQAIIANLFGWKSKETGFRRYQECFIEVGRKNGKTPLAAGILLYLLFEDGEPGAEIYGAASEYKQASLVFTHAHGMVNRESSLSDRCKVFKGQSKAIELGQPGDDDYGVYRVVSSEAFSAHGWNTHAAVVDELHTQPNRDLVDALSTSTAAREQPLLIYITTSDFEREGSICNEKEDHALDVCNGVIEDLSFLPVVYQAQLEDDWTKLETWKKANPNLGVSVSLDFIERECKRAQETPAYENTFKRLHLNIRTEQDVRWLALSDWDACGGVVLPEALYGKSCYAGIDLSSKTDITAFELYFPDEQKVLSYFWVPKENAHKREIKDKVQYTAWANQDWIKLTPGNVVDYNIVMTDIADIASKYKIEGIGFDRWGFEAVRQQLVGCGVPESIMVAFGQGFASMSEPTKELERLILAGLINHGGNPVLRWMASNVAVEMDPAGNLKPSKKKSTERIDGIVALIIAIGLASTTPPAKDSVYEERGLIIL